MADKTLVCSDCGNEFVFTEGEQAFYAEKGFTNEPKRCPECRKARSVNAVVADLVASNSLRRDSSMLVIGEALAGNGEAYL